MQSNWHGLPAGEDYCTVRPIVQSSLVLVDSEWISSGSSESSRRPSFVFLIHHQRSGEWTLWDLGIRKEYKLDFLHPSLASFQTHFEENVVDSLQSAGLVAGQINKVMISHKHWDHTGDPSHFVNADFFVGAKDASEIPVLAKNDRLVPVDFDDDPGDPIAAFDRSRDVYGDGSVIIVDAKGHTPGHLNLVVRTGADEHILLASDGCHHTKLLSSDPAYAGCTFGKYRAHGEDPSVEPSHSYYEDIGQSERHLEALRLCEANPSVQVVIAHDEEKWKAWFGGENYGLGPVLNGWKRVSDSTL